MHDTELDRLIQILREERTAIFACDHEQLAQLLAEKSKIEAQIDFTQSRPDALQTLRKEAERNAHLFKASLEGISAARARINELENVSAGLNVYTEGGQKSQVANQGRTLRKRA